MTRRLLVPVVFTLAVAGAAFLWPAPAAYALRVRVEVGLPSGGGTWIPAVVLREPRDRLQYRLEALARGQKTPQGLLDALLEDPDFLADLRHDPACAALVPDDAPDPLPPGWLSSRASLEIKGTEAKNGVMPEPYIDCILRGGDPDTLRASAPGFVALLGRWLPSVNTVQVRGVGPQVCEPAGTAAPRLRLALSLSCLALALAAGARAWRLAFKRRPAGDVAPHYNPPAPLPAPCGIQDFPPPQITAGEPMT